MCSSYQPRVIDSNVSFSIADEDPTNRKTLTGFYRKLLDNTTVTHDAALQATKKSTKPGDPVTEPIPATEDDTVQDVDIAEAARRTGKNVALNDDNQIVDKRQLLSAGLNIMAKPGSVTLSSPSGEDARSREYAEYKRRKWEEEEERRRKVGSDKQSRERLSKDIERQMLEKEAKEREEERRKEEEMKQKLAKRTTEETKMDAKARYLARKKQKTEDKEES